MTQFLTITTTHRFPPQAVHPNFHHESTLTKKNGERGEASHHEFVHHPPANQPVTQHNEEEEGEGVTFTNREALRAELRTFKPDNRVLTVTDPPRFGQLNVIELNKTAVEQQQDEKDETKAALEGIEEEVSVSSSTTSSSNVSPASPTPSAFALPQLSSTEAPEVVRQPKDFTRFALGGNSNDNFVFGPQNKPEDVEEKDTFRRNAVKSEVPDVIFRYLSKSTKYTFLVSDTQMIMNNIF